MATNNQGLSLTNKKLRAENILLHQQLRELRASFVAAKNDNIDALVLTEKNKLKVYVENAADKTYRILVEKMHEGAVTLDKEGTILYSNYYLSDMMKIPLQKLIGTKFIDLADDGSAENISSLLRQAWKKAGKTEANLKSQDNTLIPVLLSANTFSLENDFILCVIITDLSRQKENQEELKQQSTQLQQINSALESANKELVSLTYVSNHHLQEPLRKIRTFVSYILQEEKRNLSETGKDNLERMTRAAKRMQDLINDLLTYSGITTGDQKFQKTDLNPIITDVRSEYRQVLRGRKAVLETYNLSVMNVIPSQFKQLFINLISNSLKFSVPQKIPKIKISSEIVRGKKIKNIKMPPEIDYCHIVYTDNGIGFDPKYNELIFEVFQRLHNVGDYPGTGMGLAICKKIVLNHKGIMTASGKLNKGARFDIYVPVL